MTTSGLKILALGVGRSGTSFLGEMFRQNPVMAYFFEPFWGNTTIATNQCCWLTEDDREPASETLLQETFSGRLDELQRQLPAPRNPGYATRREELLAPLQGRDLSATADLVIKEIRLNMRLRWVSRVVGPALRVVHIVRDPRAVVASFVCSPSETSPTRAVRRAVTSALGVKRGKETIYEEWSWASQPAVVRCAPEHEHYAPLMASGPAHCRVAARWAMLTAHAISDATHLPRHQYLRVRYEDLCHEPHKTAAAIYAFLDRPLPEQVTTWLDRNTVAGDRGDRYSTSRNSAEMADAWRSQLSKRIARDIDAMCAPLMAQLRYALVD